MTARKSLEEALRLLLNEDEENAHVAFHNFIVKSAQSIHESFIAEDDLDNDIDESEEDDVNEAKDEDLDEADDKEEVDEGFGREMGETSSDEYFGHNELTNEEGDDGMDMDMDMNGGDLEMDDNDAEADLGDEMSDGAEEIVLSGEDVAGMKSALEELEAQFAALTGDDDEMDDMGDMDDMDDVGGMDDMADMGEEPQEEGLRFESKDEDLDEADEELDEEKDEDLDEEDEELDEAVTHNMGVASGSNHKTDNQGKHGQKTSNLHNGDARLPESADFDFDLTEEDFLDLEEGLKQVDVQMGGEQGGGKFAGEETNTKSAVAQRDKSDIKANSKDMISKRDDHSGYSRETEPTSGKLPHSDDNSKDKASTPTSVGTGGGLEKQKGFGKGEIGAGKFAGTETNVKSIIGSAGTRNES